MLEPPGRSRKPLAALVQQKTMLIVGDTMAENSIQYTYISHIYIDITFKTFREILGLLIKAPCVAWVREKKNNETLSVW